MKSYVANRDVGERLKLLVLQRKSELGERNEWIIDEFYKLFRFQNDQTFDLLSLLDLFDKLLKNQIPTNMYDSISPSDQQEKIGPLQRVKKQVCVPFQCSHLCLLRPLHEG